MAKKCPKCKSDNPGSATFCADCGTQLPSLEDIEVTETMETPKEVLTTGSTFAGRYQIIEELGKGGMGRVYKANDTDINEKVAIKLIKPEISTDKKTIERFQNEIKFARKIRHKNVCQMYDLNKEGGTYYITMEYVPGEDLKSFIRRSRQLAIGTAITIAKQVCEGLAEAHRSGVIHRDLKPNNIMIDEEGNVRIMDFGIARSLREKGITGPGVMIGTPEYMSPEQTEGKEADQRSDLYSLGVVLYEMLTGEVPYKGETPISIAMKHKSEMPKDPRTVNTDIPYELSQLILNCLEKRKEKRYKTAEELLFELRKITEPKAEKVIKPHWKNSIAVLPFLNMSGDLEQEYFCDGITEELINSLTQIRNLRVIARTSSFAFKGKQEDIREIGKKLNVETLLEGSVRKSGNRLRITAQLVDVADGSHLWSDRFDREMEDVFMIQDEISLAIVDKLKVKLLGEEKAGLVKRFTENLEAYNFYLKGRYFCRNKRTQKGLNKSLEYYQKAIEKDPEFALAYAGSANTYMFLGWFKYLPPEVAYPKMKENALKALDVDNTISQAHSAIAWVKDFYEWDWIGAERELKQAIALNPSDADARHKYSHLLTENGHFDESIAEMNLALELEPLAIDIHACSGMNLYLARRYEEAIEQLERAIELDPNFYDPHGWLGMAYVQTDRHEEAVGILQKAESFPEIRTRMIAAQGYAYAISGNRDKANERLKEVTEISKKWSVEPYFIAWIYAGLGKKDRAMDFLYKASEEHSSFMRMTIKVDPWFDTLHSYPRYIALLKKIGLE